MTLLILVGLTIQVIAIVVIANDIHKNMPEIAKRKNDDKPMLLGDDGELVYDFVPTDDVTLDFNVKTGELSVTGLSAQDELLIRKGMQLAREFGLMHQDIKALNRSIESDSEFELVKAMYEAELKRIDEQYRKRLQRYMDTFARPQAIIRMPNFDNEQKLWRK